MVNRLIEHAIAKEEEQLGTRLDYVREIARQSRVSFFKLALTHPFTRRGKVLPRAAYHLAVLVTTQHEGCSECIDMVLHAALKEHVPAHYVRAALDENYHHLPAPLEQVCSFARSILEGAEDPELREALRRTYGTKGLVELSFAITGARLYPTLKRSLGALPSNSLPETKSPDCELTKGYL